LNIFTDSALDSAFLKKTVAPAARAGSASVALLDDLCENAIAASHTGALKNSSIRL
jgi:hypothetical protein